MDKDLELTLKNNTPIYQSIEKFEDADDEMQFIANHIKRTTQHNEHIEPNRIKVMIRQARHDAMNNLKKDSDGMSDDDKERMEKDVQKIVDESITMIDNLGKQKSEELLAI
jgi:ribosome recycling factor